MTGDEWIDDWGKRVFEGVMAGVTKWLLEKLVPAKKPEPEKASLREQKEQGQPAV
jgi:hypothetical protein